MLPWASTEEAAAEKHMEQLQHKMWVHHRRRRKVGRDQSPPIRSTGIYCYQPRKNSSAASRVGEPLHSSVSGHRARVWKRLKTSTCRCPFNGPRMLRYTFEPERRMASMKPPRCI